MFARARACMFVFVSSLHLAMQFAVVSLLLLSLHVSLSDENEELHDKCTIIVMHVHIYICYIWKVDLEAVKFYSIPHSNYFTGQTMT